MPFITEELYQRLPHPASIPRAASICVAPYPEQEVYCFKDESIEKEVEFVQKIVHSIRSARSDYNLPNKTKTDAYVKCMDENLKKTIVKFKCSITTLSNCNTLELNDAPPTGCVALTISDKCQVHLFLKGIIDPEKEYGKLEKKRESLITACTACERVLSSADSAQKLPQEILEGYHQKYVQTKGELDHLVEAMEGLKKME
uniref:valine--tRNA ligase n=3 Tax=Clastoptera arizonana TaxID=38151 RepID=A0A1B6DY62_9HEMI